MKTKYYKILGEGRRACHGGSGVWKRPGSWMPRLDGPLVPCHWGYHVAKRGDVVVWLDDTIHEVEVRGQRIRCWDKTVVRQARLLHRLKRWNARTARLFACDCAERMIPHVRSASSDKELCIEAIAVARRFARGKATADELAQARGRAWIVNLRDCYMRPFSESAAWCADVNPFEAASRVVVRARAINTSASGAHRERLWQTRRLFEYLDGKRR